uniref:PUM-HD domain-containing protein n=1 Tax=Brassica oleracea TaxID=3712 RepID=A0A3P6GEI5_BRAOL|nr:unnamed protein product [Brassica oleracea]
MIDLCDEEQRTLIVRVLTSKPLDLIQICLNNYGTRVVKKMIEEVFTFRRTFSWTYITLAYFNHVHETFRADCKLPEQLFATDRFRRSDSIWSVLSTLIRVVRGRKRVVSNIGDVYYGSYVVSILCFLTTQIPDEVVKYTTNKKSGLEPRCLALVKNLNGNHVIQTCLTSLGPNDNKVLLNPYFFIFYCAEIAAHRHGCCVLQCCFANIVALQRERLVDEISRNALQLSQDSFGNYVVQYIIVQNVPAGNSHVVEKCLKHYPESRAEIVCELTYVPNFEYRLKDPFGNYVIQTALCKTKGCVHAKLVEQVSRYGILKSNPYCMKILSKGVLKK